MAKETAEQKLLRLIEQNDDADSGQGQTSSDAVPSPQEVLNAVKNVGGAVAVPPVFSNILSFGKDFFGHFGRDGFSIRNINKLLAVGVGGAVIIFIFSLIGGINSVKGPVSFQMPESIAFAADKLLPTFPDVKQYSSSISYRNIFHPFEKKEVVKVEGDAVPAAIKQISKKTKSLKLVGISWLDTPESASAMVENTESGITYFLKSGENVNGVNVQSIYADSIVLEFAGERMELKL